MTFSQPKERGAWLISKRLELMSAQASLFDAEIVAFGYCGHAADSDFICVVQLETRAEGAPEDHLFLPRVTLMRRRGMVVRVLLAESEHTNICALFK